MTAQVATAGPSRHKGSTRHCLRYLT